jgi:hypothetical protein
MWQKTLIISWFSVYSRLEYGNHVFFGILVKMMNLVSLVEDISQQVWRGSIDNGG